MPAQTALIPLDGSKLAEQALLTVPFLQALGFTKVELVTVFEDVPGAQAEASEYDEYLQKNEAIAGAYLRGKAENVSAGGIEARYIVRFGLAAEEIVNEADDVAADVLVLSSHGRTGPDRWSLGSVADKVVRLSSRPVLMIGPHSHIGLEGFRPKRIMLPLDGSPSAEVALAPAKHLASLTRADLHLVRVVTPPDRFINPLAPVLPFDDLERVAEAARMYLLQVDGPLSMNRTVLTAGFASNVSDELVRYCANAGVDLVVMASHTRIGASRLLLGGVADDLLRGSAPVLVIKPGEAKTSSLFAPIFEKVQA